MPSVFDIVTTARWWPDWHPATRQVEGDVDRPAQRGDRIVEHVTIAGVEGTGTWTVVEADRPRHVVLETQLEAGRVRISYTFEALPDGGTRFERTLEFPDLGAAVGAAMSTQSAEGVARLADLVRSRVPAPVSVRAR
jgi:Polyketide cyclase / dehydrase and lipid transport